MKWSFLNKANKGGTADNPSLFEDAFFLRDNNEISENKVFAYSSFIKVDKWLADLREEQEPSENKVFAYSSFARATK